MKKLLICLALLILIGCEKDEQDPIPSQKTTTEFGGHWVTDNLCGNSHEILIINQDSVLLLFGGVIVADVSGRSFESGEVNTVVHWGSLSLGGDTLTYCQSIGSTDCCGLYLRNE